MQDKEYAGFWIRAVAATIDSFFMIIVFGIPLFLIYGDAILDSDQLILGSWDLIFRYILPFLLTIYFWRRYLGTPGKMVTKLAVVDAETGKKLYIEQSILRYFGYIISYLPLGLGFIWAGIDKRKQGWHDKLAGTVVVRDNTEQAVEFNN